MPRRCCGGLSPVDDQGPVQQLAAEASDPPLGDGVRPGSLDRCAHDCDGLGGEDGVERGGELAVPVPIRKRNRVVRSPKSASRFRAQWVTHGPAGLAVTPSCHTRWVATSMTNRTYSRRSSTMSTWGEVAGQDALGLAGQELPPALPDSPGRYRPGGGSARPCRAPAGG